MGEVAVYKVAGILPNTLQTMLNVLCIENGLRSWQIYEDKHGVSVRIRFDVDSAVNSACPDSTTNVNTQQRHIAYTKKTPAQHRRDSKRKILKAKRPRLESETDIENERTFEHGNTSTLNCDTPVHVSCVPPAEDTITLEPLTPIRVNFENFENGYDTRKIDAGDDFSIASIESETKSIGNEDVGVKCPNCNKNMVNWNHTCDENAEAVNVIEFENDTGQSIENTDLKITSETICETEKDDECVEFDKTSCFIATFDKTRNHYTLNKFFKCDACLKYACLCCRNWVKFGSDPNYPKCCPNPCFSEKFNGK